MLPLFPKPAESDAKWFDEFGIYPISHMLVVKDEQLKANPWLSEELQYLFYMAKIPYLQYLSSEASLSLADVAVQKMSLIVGGDPLPFGLESSYKTMETFIQFNVDQKVIPQTVTPEELFPTSAH